MTWLAVHTKPRAESTAALHLERQGFSVFLPRLKQRKRRSGRWQVVVGPLFPRYLFIQVSLGEADLGALRSTRGVVDLVRFGQALVPVDERIVDALQSHQQASEGAAVLADTPYRPGDRIEILDGPFAGLSGIYRISRDRDRVELLLDLLGRNSAVAIERESLGSVL